MKYTQLLLVCCSLFLFACLGSSSSGGGDSQSSLPATITSLEFNLGIVATTTISNMTKPTSGTTGNVILNKLNGVYSGTASFSHFGNTASCELNLILTASQSSTLDGYLTSSKYCTYEKDTWVEDVDYGKSNVTVNATVPVIYRNKPSNAGNYLCTGGSDIYGYIKRFLSAHSDISTCPSDWTKLFD
ncbi:MAG: hypothetical protein NTY22_01150 [Proteobacteria bacterium]|nr:hypothetical protein [Pseudomonadota bacterium]